MKANTKAEKRLLSLAKNDYKYKVLLKVGRKPVKLVAIFSHEGYAWDYIMTKFKTNYAYAIQKT